MASMFYVFSNKKKQNKKMKSTNQFLLLHYVAFDPNETMFLKVFNDREEHGHGDTKPYLLHTL